jgi:CheY-like chemotaxis protein
MFDRFTQADTTSARQHSGLGLGLAIVRHIVELHGGSVTAESAGLGKGSTFRMSFPVRALKIPDAEGNLLDPPVKRFADDIALDKIRVMVVDDEAETRDLLKIILASQGADVEAYGSSAEALAQIDTWKPQVIVSDIGMPVQDGYTFIKKVRGLGPDAKTIPAIALTAYARAEDRMRALAAGFQMHVPKPVEASELVMVIASLIKRI